MNKQFIYIYQVPKVKYLFLPAREKNVFKSQLNYEVESYLFLMWLYVPEQIQTVAVVCTQCNLRLKNACGWGEGISNKVSVK